ncbi:hypothetical protein MRX96_027278 [Rhipicephalus microplus]
MSGAQPPSSSTSALDRLEDKTYVYTFRHYSGVNILHASSNTTAPSWCHASPGPRSGQLSYPPSSYCNLGYSILPACPYRSELPSKTVEVQ